MRYKKYPLDPMCHCRACEALGIAIDRDMEARAAVRNAAERVDEIHKLVAVRTIRRETTDDDSNG